MRVHVDGVIGQFEVEHSDGVTGPIDEVLVGHTHRGGEEAITHIAPVDEGDDLRGGAPREARLPDEAGGRYGAQHGDLGGVNLVGVWAAEVGEDATGAVGHSGSIT